jgi:hypothetical protein
MSALLAARPVWNRWRSQWATSSGLRLGAWLIVGLLWMQSLWWLGDASSAWRQREQALLDDLGRVQVLARERLWPQRADDARQQVDALRSLLWPESERGVAEAALQDWVRSTAAKAQLVVRDLALVRAVAAPPSTAAAASQAAAAPRAVRLRLNAELNRLALAGFLSELARNEHAVIVDHLVLRPASQPPSMEMELRMMIPAAAAPGAAR